MYLSDIFDKLNFVILKNLLIKFLRCFVLFNEIDKYFFCSFLEIWFLFWSSVRYFIIDVSGVFKLCVR